MKISFKKTGSGRWTSLHKNIFRHVDGTFRCGYIAVGRIMLIVTT
jgi:hypothetical protein